VEKNNTDNIIRYYSICWNIISSRSLPSLPLSLMWHYWQPRTTHTIIHLSSV